MIDSLHVSDLSLTRGDRTLFSRLSFALEAGQAAVLVGANGAGKTTLLRAVAGFIRPAAGQIRLGERGVARDPDEASGGAAHFLGHQDGLRSGRPAGRELAFQAAWAGAGPGAAEAAIDALALGPLLGLEVRKLSAGQRRRVALARLLAAPRPLWLLDEPMSPLDAHWRSRVGELMSAHLAAGGMILAAVHDPLPIAAQAVEIAA